MTNKSFQELQRRGAEFLGSKYAILGGAMSWISERTLVSAISNAGGFGVIACGSMTKDLLDAEIQETKRFTRKPFGVNLITMHPEISELIDITLSHGIQHIILAGGIPERGRIAKIKECGCKVICFTPTLALGKKLIKQGVDALVIEGMEAGGHIGPVSTSVLAQEILPHIDEVPVFVAGGVGDGKMMMNYLRMGASGCQFGTKFVCAKESIAHPNFKKAFIRAKSKDATQSVQVDSEFPVIPVRAIKNKASIEFAKAQRNAIAKYKSEELSKMEAQLEIEKYWAGALRRAAIDGDIENGSLMAGQIVGTIKEEKTTQEIINTLVQEAEEY